MGEGTRFKDFKQLNWFAIQHYDSCSFCSKVFGSNENSYIGHLEDGSCGHTCAECSSQMQDATHYASTHMHPYTIPLPKTKLWRYMDLSKFLSLLEYKSLYFTRLDHFSDSFEGALGYKKNESVWKKMQLDLRSKWIRAEYKSLNKNLSDDEVTDLANESLEEYRKNIKEWRMHNYVSCWHQSDSESEAMWRLYTRQGIAILTTFERLYQAFDSDSSKQFGMVKYINYDEYNKVDSQRSFHSFDAPWYKRESFSHEKEFRVIINDISKVGPPDWEKKVKVDLNVLIQTIYISPEADRWFFELVRDIVRNRYGLRLDIRQSEINDLPFY